MADSKHPRDQFELIERLLERAKAEPELIGADLVNEVRGLAVSIADDPAQQAIVRRLHEVASVIENLQKPPEQSRLRSAWCDFRALPLIAQVSAAFLAIVAVVSLVLRLHQVYWRV